MGGTTVYPIPPVTVYPFDVLAFNMVLSVINGSSEDQINMCLNSGNLNLIGKYMIALSTELNILSKRETNIPSNLWALVRKILTDKATELSLSDISSVKVISSSLSAASETPEQVSSTTGVSSNFLTTCLVQLL